jgi:hypothetical protein
MASELHVDAIKHSGGTSALTIDSSGNLTTSANLHSVGHVIQTAQTVNRTSGESTSTSYVELSSGMRCSITPKFSNSKLLITATCGLTAYNNSGTDCSFYHKLYDVTNSADIANSESPSRFIDYGGSGIMGTSSAPTILLQDFPNANQITITWYGKRSAATKFLWNDDHRLTQIMLQEIAQ